MSEIDKSTPVTIYNCDKKEAVGIFASITLAVKYLFTEESRREAKLPIVRKAAIDKTRILKSILPFPVAVRYSTYDQVKLLEENDFKIMEGYPEPKKSMLSFNSTAVSLGEHQTYRYQRYRNKYKESLNEQNKNKNVAEKEKPVKEKIADPDKVEYRGFIIYLNTNNKTKKIYIYRDGKRISGMPVYSERGGKNAIDTYLRNNH